ncbi:MAG: element excision factor XisI family protein [Chloroflexota bacterium]
MDKVTETIIDIVQREVAAYAAGTWYKVRPFFIADAEQHIYTIAAIPDTDYPLPEVKPALVLLARVVNSSVIIEHDSTDKPLYEALMQSGIPREQIALAYAGETIPDEGSL